MIGPAPLDPVSRAFVHTLRDLSWVEGGAPSACGAVQPSFSDGPRVGAIRGAPNPACTVHALQPMTGSP